MGKITPVSIVLFVKDWNEQSFDLWMQAREDKGSSIDGLWEFPGGKIEPGESSELAACREVLEEVGVGIIPSQLKFLTLHPYQYDNRSICLYTYFAFNRELPVKDQQQAWFSIGLGEKSLPLKGKIPPVNHYIIDMLADYLKSQAEARNQMLEGH